MTFDHKFPKHATSDQLSTAMEHSNGHKNQAKSKCHLNLTNFSRKIKWPVAL